MVQFSFFIWIVETICSRYNGADLLTYPSVSAIMESHTELWNWPMKTDFIVKLKIQLNWPVFDWNAIFESFLEGH